MAIADPQSASSASKLLAAFHGAPCAAAACDLAGRVAAGNTELLRLFGSDPAGQPLPVLLDGCAAALADLLAGRVSAIRTSAFCRNSEGEHLQLLVLGWRSGCLQHPWLFLLFTHFPHEQLAAPRTVVPHLPQLLEIIPQLLWSATADGKVEYYNSRSAGILRLRRGDDGFWQWLEAIHPDDRAAVSAAWRHAMMTGELYEAEERLAMQDGTFRWHLSRGVPIRDETGSVIGWCGTATDIQEQKAIEQTLREREIRLRAVTESLRRAEREGRRVERQLQDRVCEVEALNAQLQQLMVETHHRVKNNLQLVSSLIEMHVRRDPAAAGCLSGLTEQVRILAAIHDLLSAAAHDGTASDQVNVQLLLEKLFSMVKRAAPNHTLRVEVAQVILPVRKASSLALIANELVSNALKHGRTTIDVVFAAGKGQAEMCVDDDGVGFPAEFDPVRQARIGLRIVQGLARQDLLGEVSFGNRPGGGGRARLVLPL